MLTTRRVLPRFASVSLALALASCGSPEPAAETPETLNQELADANVAGIGDPIVAAALQAPLMSDPTLSQSANADTIRPPSRPDPESVPTDDPASAVAAAPLPAAPAPTACPDCAAARAALTPVALIAAERTPAIAACAPRLRYSAEWANRLPSGLALYPDAHVAEAAGTDEAGCRVRVARFASAAPLTRLVDWYHATAGTGGWAPVHRADGTMHAISGQRRGAGFTVYVAPRTGGGSDVTRVASGG